MLHLQIVVCINHFTSSVLDKLKRAKIFFNIFIKMVSTQSSSGSSAPVISYYIDENNQWTPLGTDPQHGIMAEYFMSQLTNVILAYNSNFPPNRARELARAGIFQDPTIIYDNESERNTELGRSVGTKCNH